MDAATDNLIRSQLSNIGLRWVDGISWNATAMPIHEQAIARGEGLLSEGGALAVSTGAIRAGAPMANSSCATQRPKSLSGGTTTKPCRGQILKP